MNIMSKIGLDKTTKNQLFVEIKNLVPNTQKNDSLSQLIS